jgi:FkbM family methyltransferase
VVCIPGPNGDARLTKSATQQYIHAELLHGGCWPSTSSTSAIKKSGERAVISKLKAAARHILRPPLHTPDYRAAHTVLGTDYGGWPLLTNETPQGALVFSFGIGEDISFDIAAIEKFGCTVHGFDPTPRCRAWVEQQNLPRAFKFHLLGLGATEGELEFFAPEKGDHVSYSAQPAANSDLSLKITAPVQRLEKIVEDIGEGVPDVLKMDIEGFEYDVIDDILRGAMRPYQLLVEFHHRMYGIDNKATYQAVDKLRLAGYQLFYVSDSGHEYGFVFRGV